MEDSNSMEVPWVLGFIGNNRATNVVESGTAYYSNTHIKTQRWGCLSTDAVKSVKLYATNCRLETVVNDDPWKVGGMPGAGMPAGLSGGAPGGAMPEGGMPGVGKTGGSGDLTATFKNVTLKGDIVSSMTSESDVVVTFENAAITGAITTAASKSRADIDGVKLSKKTYYYIGAVRNTYCATDDKYGMKVSLDGKSKWVVDENSYLTVLTIAEGADITAPEGYSLAMTVNGSVKLGVNPANQ